MVRISRLRKEHDAAASLSSLIALWGFVDEHTFLTKSGALGVVFRLAGVDDECFDHAERHAVVDRMEQVLKRLDQRCRLYQYLVKRQAEPPVAATHYHPLVAEAVHRRDAYMRARQSQLFSVELFMVLLFEGWQHRPSLASRVVSFASRPGDVITEWFSVTRVMRVMDEQLTRARAALHQEAQALATQLADAVRPQMLGRQQAFAFFRRLLTYSPAAAPHAPLKYDTHLDFFVSDATVECDRDHLRVDEDYVTVLTMKEPPARTCAHVFNGLQGIAAPFIACLEWQRLADGRVRRELHTRRRHFFNRRVSLVNYVSPDTKSDEMLVDESAAATVTELGQCLTEMDVHGHVFGTCSLSIVLADRDADALRASAAQVGAVFASHDGAVFHERYNLLNAWLAILPGNGAHNLRRMSLLNTTAADLSFLFAPNPGSRTSDQLGGREYLAAFEGEQGTPYFWNLHVGDVGHLLISGATGSGKSFLLNFVLTHAQKYDPSTVIFDLGGGYERLTTRLGGSVWKMTLSAADVRINPFCLAPTPEHLHFLAAFVGVLMRSGGDAALTVAEEREIREGVENVYALDPPLRQLGALAGLLSRGLVERLHRWIAGGPYAALFDQPTDTLTFQRLQAFDFQGLEQYPAVLEALLFYVLHRAAAAVNDVSTPGHLKIFALDEAWRFARDPTVRAYITDALKTWRKKNAAVLLATQSVEDFGDTPLLRTVVESCPTKLFLANPAMDVDATRRLFHLNETEAAAIVGLRPRQQLLLKRPDVAKVLNLHVDPQSYWLYTNTSDDNARLRAAEAQHGSARAIDVLAAS